MTIDRARVADAVALDRRPLTPQTVLALQNDRGHTCVSLLLTITPGGRVDPADQARFDALVVEARRRLAMEASTDARAVEQILDGMVTTLDGPVDRSVAVFVSQTQRVRVDLPVTVTDRSVLDPSFATRDLVRALHRTPRHIVLLLSDDRAHLLDGSGDVLIPVHARFPLIDLDHVPGEPARPAFLHTVDRALGAHRALHPAPLIVAGPQPTLASFLWASGQKDRLEGSIVGTFGTPPSHQLRAHIRARREGYLLSRQAEALTLLARRLDQGRAVHGVQAAWTAARRDHPEMLAVEQGFFHPARLTDGGDRIDAAADPHAVDVIDDLVDELIELVMARGGRVALLDDHTLPAGHGVALTLRKD